MQNINKRVKWERKTFATRDLAYLDLPYRFWDFNIQSEMLAPVMSYIVSPDATCEILHKLLKIILGQTYLLLLHGTDIVHLELSSNLILYDETKYNLTTNLSLSFYGTQKSNVDLAIQPKWR